MPAAKKKSPVQRKTPVRKKVPVKKKTTNSFLHWWVIGSVALLLLLASPYYYGYISKNVISGWRWVKDMGGNGNYRVYKSFNIRMPEQYKVCGIDVSYYQGKINWPMVKEMHEDGVHISFAFIKATEGLLLTDPYFHRNWHEAPKAGIICGAYHYFRPRLDGKWQARFFLQNVKTRKGNLPMVVDIEELDGTSQNKMRIELQAFLDYIEAHTGIKPIIYSGLKFYEDNLAGNFDNYTLWIAHYYQPELQLSKSTNWKFWQHSDKAKVNGINHTVDFNVFKGDSLSFRQLLVH